MATSGQTIYSTNRNQIIEAALRKVGALALGQTPETQQYTDASLALNNLVSQLQALGMHLWKRVSYNVPLVAGQDTYTIGVGQAINTPFPLKPHQAILVDTVGNSQIDVTIMSEYDFNRLPRATGTSGMPVNITYQPFINYGVVKVWPAPDTTSASTKVLKLVYQKAFDVFTTSTDDIDFPPEWVLPLTYGLAVLLAPEYGLPLADRKLLQEEYKTYLDTALGAGVEEASLFFQLDHRR